jgi:hypothetical protein
MATIRSFEDLEAWKKARLLSKEIWKVSQSGSFSKDYKLKDQINSESGDREHIDEENFKRLYLIADEIGKTINGLIEYLNKSTVRGMKFKDRL